MRTKKPFGKRNVAAGLKEPKKKYLLVFEGDKTEAIYFEAVSNYKNIIGIDSLVELIPVVREYHEEGISNPKKMVTIFHQSLEKVAEEFIAVKDFLGWILGDLAEHCSFMQYEANRKSVERTIKNIASDYWDDISNATIRKGESEEMCQEILNKLRESLGGQFSWPEIVNHISEDIESRHQITYNSDLDQVCFVIDRDKKSFKKEQYDETLGLCRKHGYGFYLSNPCFEFWLLLHFLAGRELSEEQKRNLLDNKKWDGRSKTPKRTYAENLLREYFPMYNKSSYRAEKLMHYIDEAVNNASRFCEDEELLKNQLGSRVGILIKELKEKSSTTQ